MGAAAVPLLAAGGGLFLQHQSNQDAKKAANKATGNQKDLIKRQTWLFDEMAKMVQSADKEGQFSPDARLKQLETDTNYYSSRDTGNTAAAARTLGYRQGDTAPLKSIRTIDSKYKLQYGQQAQQIRQGAFMDKLGAYGALNGGQLNTGISAYGNMANQAQGQQGSPAGIFQSIMPFLNQSKTKAQVQTQPTDWSFLKNLRF